MPPVPRRSSMYHRILQTLLDRGILSRSSTVLAACGGPLDHEVFLAMGFTNVTIANLDSRMTPDEFKPFAWSFQDAENLGFPDNAFDLVIISAGLHHCPSPHRALLEAYRVARRCAVAIEAQDGLMTRTAARLGLVDDYELTAVFGNDFKFGGLRNTAVPNYIYRWTPREITKTLSAFAPYSRPNVLFFREYEPAIENLATRRRSPSYLIFLLGHPVLKLITWLLPSQRNLFGWAALKPDLEKHRFPWLRLNNGAPDIDEAWVRRHWKVRAPGPAEPTPGSTKPESH